MTIDNSRAVTFRWRELTITEKIEKTDDNTSNPYDQYTNNALTDVILFQITSKKKRNTEKNRPRNPYRTVDGDANLEWVNLVYACLYLHRFFLFKPSKPFEIHLRDLTPSLVDRLKQLEFSELNKIMVGVVRRILEAVDSYYYHTSGIHGKVSWRFVN